jgi:hypothetical protein
MPAAVEAAVMRSLAKRPDDRFASAREMRKQLEAALRDGDVGLIETQRIGLELVGEPRSAGTPVGVPTAPIAADDAGGRHVSVAGPLADELEPEPGRRPARRVARWLALAAALLVAGGAATVLLIQRAARYHATVDIAGVTFTKGAVIDGRLVETDGAIEPAELAKLYASTLNALQVYARTRPVGAKLEIADPVDVLLAVPAGALCEPSAYLDHQAPNNCRSLLSATAIGAKGTHRLMVVSDRAQLVLALRKGVAQAACEFSPVEDNTVVREICDVTSRFAESAN